MNTTTRSNHRADTTAELFWFTPSAHDWKIPARGHGVRVLQQSANGCRAPILLVAAVLVLSIAAAAASVIL